MKNLLGLFIILSVIFTSCSLEVPDSTVISDTGVEKVTADIKVQSNGMTVEQENIKNRLEAENVPGSIKHLYIISAMSGEVLIYSTVKGKVTSSGKRLTNTVELVTGDAGEWSGDFVMPKIQDDGTYGSSIPYLYWWDVQGRYHQHYVSGGQILHISDNPIPVKSITINMELE